MKNLNLFFNLLFFPLRLIKQLSSSRELCTLSYPKKRGEKRKNSFKQMVLPAKKSIVPGMTSLFFIFSVNAWAADACLNTDHTGQVSSSNLTYTNTDRVYFTRWGAWNRVRYYIQVQEAGTVDVSITDNTPGGDVRFNASTDICPDYPGAGTSWSHTFTGAGDFNIDVTAWRQRNIWQYYTITVTFTPASASADLRILENGAPSPDPATIGQDVTFEVRTENRGPDTSENDIVVKVSYNQDVTVVSAAQTYGGGFTCDVTSGTLSAGSFITCTKTSDWTSITNHKDLTFVVTPSDTGTLTQVATIESTVTDDPDPSNNTLTSSATVESGGSPGPSECPVGANEDYRDFCLRQKVTLPGNMVTVGNTIFVLPTYSTSCSSYRDESYVDNASGYNSNYTLCRYWSDSAYPSTEATVSSGTPTSNIPDPANSTLQWAGLYWQSIIPNSQSITGHTVKLKNGNDDFVDVSYTSLDFLDGAGRAGYISYSAFADVTNILKNNGWLEGTYTVADIPTTTSNIQSLGQYGAWTLVLVYRNDAEKLRNFSIFDGWRRLSGFDSLEDSEQIVNISGFYTPKQGEINSAVSVFTAEGDKNILGDYLYGRNANNNDAWHELSYVNGQTFNSAIMPAGTFSRTPNPTNNMGIDIQTFQLGTDGENILEHRQSSIDFKFKTRTSGGSRDTYFPSMIAFNTELYAPQLCYDYAYKQYGHYFTEDNNGSYDPYIVGDNLDQSEDIVVELFIRNDEDSDTNATDMTIRITDINTSQASYVANSAYITKPGEIFSQAATPNPLQDIYIGNVGGKEHFSVDYNLSLTGSSINMPIRANLEYTLLLSDATGITVPLDYNTTLNADIPLCTNLNFSYYPEYNIFNVENSALSSSQKYNLPTQTARRAGDHKIVSYDAENVHSREGVSTVVGIEIIDADKYHDIKASCVEPDSALTPRVWLIFENNATAIDFDKAAIDTAIAKGMVSDYILGEGSPISMAEDYYSFVRENASFRAIYHSVGDGSLINLEPKNCIGNQIAPCFEVTNFPDLTQLDAGAGSGVCAQDVDRNPSSTDTIPQYCGNAGNAGLDSSELAQCMECIYGYNLKYICSRDNFSIRPESFRVALSDQDQNDPTQQQHIAYNDDTAKSHDNGNGDRIVAGYNYHTLINATNHQNDSATPGYVASFTEDGMDGERVFSLKWWSSPGVINCNDTSDHNKTATFNNGTTEQNLSNAEIGKYDLHLFDKVWTRVDWDSSYLSHHSTYSEYFENGKDCRENTSYVPVQSSATASYLDDMSGCDINTSNHTNSDNGDNYTDMPLHIFPYTFNQDSIVPNIGPYTRTNGQTFIYMDTPPLLDAEDKNMSYNMNGTFYAAGYDDGRLSNFVTECYAEDVDMDLHYTYNSPPPTQAPYLWYSIKDYNTTESSVVYNPASGSDDYNRSAGPDSSNTLLTIAQEAAFFAKDMRGSITMDLGYNFKRDYNNPVNPRDIAFKDFNITYENNPTGIKADLQSDYQIYGNKDLDHNATFVYGRAKPSRDFYDDVTADFIDTPVSIVVYCDQDPVNCSAVYNINTALGTTDEYDWYLSLGHVTTDNDGNISLVAGTPAVSPTGATVNPADPAVVPINNSGGMNNPDVRVTATATVRPLDVNIDFGANTNRWVIYNEDNNSIPSPFYRVRFIGESDWAGYGDTGHVVDENVSVKKNRRLGW